MVTVIAVLRQLGYSEEKVHEMMAHAAVPSTRHGDHQVGGFCHVFEFFYLSAASRASTRSVFSHVTPRSSRPM